MILELLGHRDYIRVLLALEDKPRRFSQLQRELKLNPAQVDRALSFLREGLWIIPHTVPTPKGRVLVEYHLGRRGTAFLRSFKAFSEDVKRRETALGHSEVAELRSLYG